MAGRRTALTALAALPLIGCGFQLRSPPRLPFGSVALTGFPPRSLLAEELKRELAAQVRVLDAPAQADVVLHAIDDVRERSIVASTAAAEVREMQLRVRLIFRAHTPGGRELIPRAELRLWRDMNYSETQTLAKEYEETELFREMQSDVVAQVLRRLAAVKV